MKGVVRDADTRDPIANSFAGLVDTAGRVVYGSSTDFRGRYVLLVREPGVYAVVATSPGYLRQVSGWLQLMPKDTFEVTSRLGHAINTLAPVVIRAQRDSLRALNLLGLSPKSLAAGSIITPLEVSTAARGSSTVYELVESLHHPSLRVTYIYLEGTNPGAPPPGWYHCIVFARTNNCVTVFIDGVRHVTLTDKLDLDAILPVSAISYMIFLHPQEAGVLYGESSSGALLIVTKSAEKR